MVISGPNKFFQDIIYSIPKLCCHSEGTCCLIIVLLWGFTIWKKNKIKKNPGPRATLISKGQLISKCPFGVIVWTKIATNKPEILSA